MSTHVQQAIVAFGPQARPRLAAAMRPKTITVCEAEPVHPEPCVVAIEPVSDVILRERSRERRDAASGNEAMAEAVHGLAVEIVQATSDEARGLLAHAREGLGAHHSPDLFHVPHAVTQGVCPALAAKAREAAAARERAERQPWAEPATRDACDDPMRPRGPGQRPGCEQRSEKAQPQQAVATEGRARAVARQVAVREALQGLSSAYHPDDLATGEARSTDDVARDLQPHVDQIQRVVTEAGRSERARGHVENARHVLGAMGSTIACVHVQLLARMVGLALGIAWPRVVWEFLVPGVSRPRVGAKAPTAERRRAIEAVSDRLLAWARAPDGPLATLEETPRVQVERVARAGADLCQRSRACVAGRHGPRALRHHRLHRLSTQKLDALTAVHNFFLTRPDGTTAGERFFGVTPADMFEWILAHMAVPVRPAQSRALSHIRAA